MAAVQPLRQQPAVQAEQLQQETRTRRQTSGCLLCLQVLHLVDFEQLKIENQQYLERIDGKNKELLQLKLSTGKTVQVRVTPFANRSSAAGCSPT
jgi:hypothetical protein